MSELPSSGLTLICWSGQIPEAVQRQDSPAYNDGFVWIHGGKPAAAKAYAEQSRRDLVTFLRARAEEMVSGGLMFLLLKGRKDSDPTVQYDPDGVTMFGTQMEGVFNELISEVCISLLPDLASAIWHGHESAISLRAI